MPGGLNIGYLIISGLIMLVSRWVSGRLQKKFKHYSQVTLRNGMSGKEIAEKMFLSPKTIDGCRDSLFTKLNVKNRVGMVMYALKHEIYVQ